MENLKLSNLNFSNIFKFEKLILLIIFTVFLLGRVSMGLYIFNFRLGELLIGFSALIFLFFLIRSILNFKTLTKFEKICAVLFSLILIHFLFLLLANGYKAFELYPFKASSYIWVLGFFYIGMVSKYNFSSKASILSIFFVLLIDYYSSIFGITDSQQEIFLNYTDKFDYLKASDLLIFFIFFSYYVLRSLDYKKNFINQFLILFSIFYLPLIMHKSRGASIGFILFIFLLLSDYLKSKPNKKTNLIIFSLSASVFIISAFIVSKSPLDIEEIPNKVVYVSTGRYDKPPQNKPQIYDDYPVLYLEGTRLFSSDGNLDWRLQIWQDVFSDTSSKNLIFTGYGYNYKIPAMEEEYRSGNDGTNENVHNFFVNIYARGGLIHLLLYVAFFVVLVNKANSTNKLKSLIMIMLPVLITSFFDASMENAHFPIIFYYLLGNIVKEKN